MRCDTLVANNTLSIEVLVKDQVFFKKFKSVSDFHRKLTNGWNRTGGKSNREWWKANIQLGYYTYSSSKGSVTITYFIQLKDGTQLEKAVLNLRYRIKNQIICTINLLPPIAAHTMIESYSTRLTYQSFGQLYKTKQYEHKV